MRRIAWVLIGGAALVAAAIAIDLTTSVAPPVPKPSASRTGVDPSRSTSDETPSDDPTEVVRRPSVRPGPRLGSSRASGRHSNAQSVYDTALAGLRRLEAADAEVARDLYLQGHGALERIEDELADDDEPGRAKLRVDADALRDEMKRLFDDPR